MAPGRHGSSATLLALVYAALVLYASLYPFDGWRWPPGQALATLALLPTALHQSAFDVVSNLLGYLPLGALLLFAARPFRGLRYLWAVLVLAVTFSLLNLWLLPPIVGVGFAVVTSVWRAVPLALAIALALLVTPWASGVSQGTSAA